MSDPGSGVGGVGGAPGSGGREPNPGFFNAASVKSYEAAISSLIGTVGRLRDAFRDLGPGGSATAQANRTAGTVAASSFTSGLLASSTPVSGAAQAKFTGTVAPGEQDHPQGGTDDRGGFHARVRDYNQQKASFGGYSPGGMLAAAAGGGIAAGFMGRGLDAAHGYVAGLAPIDKGYDFDILARQRALYTNGARAANFSALQAGQKMYGTGAQDFASATATLQSQGFVRPGPGGSVTGDPFQRFTQNVYQAGLGTLSGADSAQITSALFNPGTQNRLRGIGVSKLPMDISTGNINDLPTVYGSILDRMSATGKFQYNDKSATALAQGQNWRTSLRSLGLPDNVIENIATYGEAAAKAGHPLSPEEVQRFVGTAGTGKGDNGGMSDQQMKDAASRAKDNAALSAFHDAEGSIRAMNTAAKTFADWVNGFMSHVPGAGRTAIGAGGIASAVGHLGSTALMLKGAQGLFGKAASKLLPEGLTVGGMSGLAETLGVTAGTGLTGLAGATAAGVGSAVGLGVGLGGGAAAVLDRFGLLGAGHHSIRNIPGNVGRMLGIGGPDQTAGGGENTIGTIEGLANAGPSSFVTSSYRAGGNSLHARHEAVDFSTKHGAYDDPGDLALNHWWAQNYGNALSELIYTGPGGITIKDGKVIPPEQWASFWGQDVINQHHNHVHVGLTSDAAKKISTSGGVSVGAASSSNAGKSNNGYKSLRWSGGGSLNSFTHGNPSTTTGSSPAGTVSGGGITAAEQAAYAVGLRGDALATAVAIAGAESSYDPSRHNSTPPDDSWGLWQVNYFGGMGADRTARYGPRESMVDPMANARAMWDISGHGTNWHPWSTYTGGQYRAYLAQAKAAAASAGYADGSWQLPSDQIAKVHKDEMIVPARMAEVIRQEMKGGASSGTNTHVHTHHWSVVVQRGTDAEAERLAKMVMDKVEHKSKVALVGSH